MELIAEVKDFYRRQEAVTVFPLSSWGGGQGPRGTPFPMFISPSSNQGSGAKGVEQLSFFGLAPRLGHGTSRGTGRAFISLALEHSDGGSAKPGESGVIVSQPGCC